MVPVASGEEPRDCAAARAGTAEMRTAARAREGLRMEFSGRVATGSGVAASLKARTVPVPPAGIVASQVVTRPSLAELHPLKRPRAVSPAEDVRVTSREDGSPAGTPR